MKIIIECSGAKHITRKIAKKAKKPYSKLEIKKFPDNEIDIRFSKNIYKKNIIFVQSFYDNLNEKIIETLFAGHTAKDLHARKVNLIALYFPYLRKDKRFKSNECISAEVMGKLFSVFDRIYIVEPHLHRIKNINKLFSKGKRVTVVSDIVDYVKKIRNPVLIGPDMESMQWADSVAKLLNKKAHVLRKKRLSSRKVKIKVPKIDIKNRNIVVIDDIISTGHTMLETVKGLKKLEPKRIYCICFHGIFVENALEKLKKHAEVISCNTIPNKVSKIDISKTIAEEIK